MYKFIGIESLAANALIEIFEKTSRREVSFNTLVRYGMKIVKILHQHSGYETILLLSKEYQLNLVSNYSEFFDVDFYGPENGTFRLKTQVKNLELLREHFLWTMSVKVIEAFLSEEATMELGIGA